MSYVLFGDDVVFFQRLLKIEGFYTGKIDGIWGPLTEKAVTRFNEVSEQIKQEYGQFDQRTEGHIFTLSLHAQKAARGFMNRVSEAGFNVKIISGTRTYEEQNRLFRKGRYGNPGPIVTNARGGRSNHNFCIAWDIGIFTHDGGYATETKAYVDASKHGKNEDVEWGGDWARFFDPSHYQIKTNLTLAQLRSKFEQGETMFA